MLRLTQKSNMLIRKSVHKNKQYIVCLNIFQIFLIIDLELQHFIILYL